MAHCNHQRCTKTTRYVVTDDDVDVRICRCDCETCASAAGTTDDDAEAEAPREPAQRSSEPPFFRGRDYFFLATMLVLALFEPTRAAITVAIWFPLKLVLRAVRGSWRERKQRRADEQREAAEAIGELTEEELDAEIARKERELRRREKEKRLRDLNRKLD